MKISKKLLAVGLFLAIAGTAQAMDQKPSWKKRAQWVTAVGEVALGLKPVSILMAKKSTKPSEFSMDLPTLEPKEFTDLPKDMQNQIIGILLAGQNASSLEEASQTINSLARINKELNALINDPTFCLQTIKHLAKKFDLDELKVTKKLYIDQAKKINAIYYGLVNKTLSSTFSAAALRKYLNMTDTPENIGIVDLINLNNAIILELALTDAHFPVEKVKFLLEEGANPNLKPRGNNLTHLEHVISFKNQFLKHNNLEEAKRFETMENLMKEYSEKNKNNR